MCPGLRIHSHLSIQRNGPSSPKGHVQGGLLRSRLWSQGGTGNQGLLPRKWPDKTGWQALQSTHTAQGDSRLGEGQISPRTVLRGDRGKGVRSQGNMLQVSYTHPTHNTTLSRQTPSKFGLLEVEAETRARWTRCFEGGLPWRRKWQPGPALLPGKSHGRRSLVGHNSWGRKESDTTERLHFTSLSRRRVKKEKSAEVCIRIVE